MCNRKRTISPTKVILRNFMRTKIIFLSFVYFYDKKCFIRVYVYYYFLLFFHSLEHFREFAKRRERKSVERAIAADK